MADTRTPLQVDIDEAIHAAETAASALRFVADFADPEKNAAAGLTAAKAWDARQNWLGNTQVWLRDALAQVQSIEKVH